MVDAAARTTAAPIALAEAPKPRRLFSWRTVRHQPRFLIGGTFIFFLILVAIAAPLLVRTDPKVSHPADAIQSPSAQHLMGTDDLGRDVLGRAIYGSRVSLAVGIIAVSIGLITGVVLGMIAGYTGGWADLLILRAIDALLAFPALLLAIAITSALGPTLRNTMIAIGIVAIPVYTRLTRGQVLQAKEREYVEAARTAGASQARVAFRHILPNILNPLIVQASLSIAFAILAEASLSFLGLGVQPPTPTWGADINHARAYLSNGFWWMSVGPGVAILLTVFSFNLLGDSIRDILDPRLRDR
ncbi:MAG TPA: ABC transporter permease [Thermomicrobiales bacterium]|jgi:ABC-type dipeptide/oligopeptide/nickel transport system permease subunit